MTHEEFLARRRSIMGTLRAADQLWEIGDRPQARVLIMAALEAVLHIDTRWLGGGKSKAYHAKTKMIRLLESLDMIPDEEGATLREIGCRDTKSASAIAFNYITRRMTELSKAFRVQRPYMPCGDGG